MPSIDPRSRIAPTAPRAPTSETTRIAFLTRSAGKRRHAISQSDVPTGSVIVPAAIFAATDYLTFLLRAIFATALCLLALMTTTPAAHAAAGVTINSPSAAATINEIPFDVDFSVVETGSDTFCRADGGAWASCTDPSWTIELLANGAHTLQILNRDGAGATASASVPITLDDTTAPTATVDTPIDGSTLTDSSGTPTITTTITDSYHRALCAYDDNPSVDCDLMPSYDPTPLTNGAHSARVTVYDGAGNTSTAIASIAVADSTAPSLSVTSPSEAATVTDQIEFDLTTDDPVAHFFIQLDGGPTEEIEVSGTSFSWHPVNLANGAHSARFSSIDAAGNESATTRLFTLADVTAPSLSNLQPADASTVEGDRILVGFDSDDDGVTATCTVDDHAPFDCYINAMFAVRGLPPGAHQFVVDAVDQSGNSTTASTDFTVSTTSEGALTIDSPADGTTFTAEPRLLLSGVGPIDHARCRLNGVGDWFDCAHGERLRGLANGATSVEVRALTSAGDLLTANSSFTTTDLTAPSLNVDYPSAGESMTRLTAFAPQLRASETYDDGGESDGVITQCKLDTGTFKPCDRVIAFDATLASGAHSLQVRATDWVGNSAAQTVAFSVGDATAPAITIVSPADGASFAIGRLAVDFWSDDPDASFTCHVDAEQSDLCSPWFSWLPNAESEVALNAGSHTLYVTGTDQAGNATTVSISVTIADVTAPILTIASPAGGATVTDRVIARWTSDEQVVRVRCRVDAGAWISDPERCLVASAYGAASGWFSPAPLVNGSRSLTIEAFDAAGNMGTASVLVTVADSTPPRVRVLGFEHPGDDGFNDAPTAVIYSADDPMANFECQIDSAPFTQCDGTGFGRWSFTPPADGNHTIVVRATDPAGLTADASLDFVVADTTPPIVSVSRSGTSLFNGAMVPISFNAQVQPAGATTATCSLDGGAGTNCFAGTFAVNFVTGGTHTLTVTALDAASNQTVKTLKLTVDPSTIPPPTVPPVTPPVTTPVTPGVPSTPPPAASPAAPAIAIAAIKPKLGGSIITVVLSARIAPLGSVFSCSGPATVSAVVGKKPIKQATTQLAPSNPGCAVVSKLKLKRKLAAGKRVTFGIAYAGNATIGAFTASKSVKIKKR